MGNKHLRKVFAMLLCVIMVVSLLPAGVLAADGDTVPLREDDEHIWSTDPVWVWAEDYSTATARYACLVEGCDDEWVAQATVVRTENDPTCQEQKVYTYTATAVGPDGDTDTNVKESGGVHEEYIYKLVSTIKDDGQYLIMNTDAAGTGYAFTNNNLTAASSSLTIHAPAEDDEDIDANKTK